MKQFIKKTISHPLFSGSLIMILGSNATSFINYIYHLVIGRLLGPVSYGELASLLSLLGLAGIVPGILGPVVVRFISSSKKEQEISALINWLDKKVVIAGVIMFFLIVILSPLISSFLKISDWKLVALLGLTFVFSLRSLFNRSVLQGLLKFKETVSSVLIENLSKLLLGLVFVYLGYAVLGAIAGLVLATFIGWYFSRIYIRDFLHLTSGNVPHWKTLGNYSLLILLQSIFITSLYTSDQILVKHFFSSYQAGIYASLSTLAKIIFYAAGPIMGVMFPIVSKNHSLGKKNSRVFLFSFLLILVISILILIIYSLFPQLVILILFGSSFLQGSELLIYFGIFIALFTLSSLIVSYFVSMNIKKVVVFPFLASVSQILGIWFYHPDLKSVIYVSLVVTSLLLASLLAFFFVTDYERK